MGLFDEMVPKISLKWKLQVQLGTILMREGQNVLKLSINLSPLNCPKLTECIDYLFQIVKYWAVIGWQNFW